MTALGHRTVPRMQRQLQVLLRRSERGTALRRSKRAYEHPVTGRRPSIWTGHATRLTTAAGISTIVLRCHEDTWNEICKLMRHFKGWSVPETGPGPSSDLVEARLSGPKIIAMLFGMRTHAIGFSGFNRALARRVYIGLAEVVDLVDSANPARALPAVVLDDIAGGRDGGETPSPLA